MILIYKVNTQYYCDIRRNAPQFRKHKQKSYRLTSQFNGRKKTEQIFKNFEKSQYQN